MAIVSHSRRVVRRPHIYFVVALLAGLVILRAPLAGKATVGTSQLAQAAPDITWVQQFGTGAFDYSGAVTVDANGVVFLVGSTGGSLGGTSSGYSDAFILKYDAEGNILWTTEFGTDKDDYGSAIAVDAGGDIFVVGSTAGGLQTANAGFRDVFLRKYDVGGNPVWTTQFGTTNYDSGSGIALDGTGSIYVYGGTEGSLQGANAGSRDVFLRKYDADGNELWTRQFGTAGSDEAGGIAMDRSGNVFVAGYTGGGLDGANLGLADVFLRKYDAYGGVLWTRQFGTSGIEFGRALAADDSGNVYVVGNTQGSLEGTSRGSADAFVRKYDANGTVLWTRQFGTGSSDDAYAVALARNGDLYVAGRTMGALQGNSAGDVDAFVRKLDSNGNELWTRQFGTSGADYGQGVAADGMGNAYVAGTTTGNLQGTNAGDSDIFVRKYESAGAEVWTKQFGTGGTDYLRAVAAPGSGGVIVVGDTTGGLYGAHEGGYDAFVRRYDATGNMLWARSIGTGQDDYGKAVVADGSGNFYVAGQTSGTLQGANAGGSDAFVRKFGNGGHELWTRQFGTSDLDFANAVATDEGGNPYVVGSTFGNLEGSNTGQYDAFARKYDADGNILWTRQFGTAFFELVRGLALDKDGNIYIVGETNGSLEGSNAGGYDVFLREYGANGDELWTKQFGTAGDDYGYAIALDAIGNVYVAGRSAVSLPGADGGSKGAFLRKYDASHYESWTRQFGADYNDYARAVAVDGRGRVYVTGETNGSLGGQNAGAPDAYLRQYDGDGAALWTKQFGGNRSDVASAVALESSGSVYVGGYTTGAIQGLNAGGIDAFIVKLVEAPATPTPTGTATATATATPTATCTPTPTSTPTVVFTSTATPTGSAFRTYLPSVFRQYPTIAPAC